METNLTSDFNDKELGLDNYTVYREDRDLSLLNLKSGGGVLIAIRNDIHSHKCSIEIDSNGAPTEQLFVKFQYMEDKYLLGVTYIRPKSHLSYYDSHALAVEQLMHNNPDHKVILMGDYNLPRVHWNNDEYGTSAQYNRELMENISDLGTCSAADLISDSFSSLGLFQKNYIFNNNGYALDLVFTNFKVPNCQLVLDPFKKLDKPHPAIYLEFMAYYNACNSNNNLEYKFETYDFKKGDYLSINEEFSALDWNSILDTQSDNIDNMVDSFYGAVYSVCDKYIPKKTIKPKSNTYPHWFSSELIEIIQDKKRIHRLYKRFDLESDYVKFVVLRARCKKLTRICYLEYLKKVEQNITENIKGFWNHVNLERGVEGIPSSMSLDGVTSTDGFDIANMFATNFESVYNSTTLPDYIPSTSSDDKLEVKSILLEEVKYKLNDIDANKGPGPDGLTPFFLKNCSNTLCQPITILFNASLKMSSFPTK